MTRSTHTEQRYAVCIGINAYAPGASLGDLRFAERDAEAVDKLLGDLGFPAANRRLLIGPAATLAAVNEALATYILDKPGPNDLVVFYFAGHSAPVVINADSARTEDQLRTEVFLAPYNFDRQQVKLLSFRRQQALGMERLKREFFEGEGSRKRLFILDSCYSGDFYGPRYRSDSPDPVQGYIQAMLDSSSTGRVSLSSCLPFQKAQEDPSLGHGRMTYYLLRALRGEAPLAQRRDGSITVNTLFEYLAEVLPDDQRPVLGGVQHDLFVLTRYPPIDIRPRFDSKTASPADRSIELLASHLCEWKIVHSTVQSLLFSAVPFEKAVYLAERQLTEDSIYHIEEMWHPQCSAKANKIMTDFDKLTLISNRAIDDLYTIIGNGFIDNGIRNLQPDNREMLKSLRRYMNELLNSLRDVMVVTDLNIMHIAENIKAQSPQ